jgi:hypothetical protein
VRDDRPGHPQVAAHLDRQVRLEVVLAEPALVGGGGGVDEDVDAAEGLGHRRDHRGDRVIAARVGRHREGAELLRGGGQGLLATRDQRDARALGGEGARRREPDAATRTGDDRAASVQL